MVPQSLAMAVLWRCSGGTGCKEQRGTGKQGRREGGREGEKERKREAGENEKYARIQEN